MRRRSVIAAALAAVAVVASVVAVSVVWPGLDARTTPAADASVWALQTADGRRYARVNTAIGELDTVRSVANPSEVAETADGAYLFAQSYGKIARIDEAMPADLDDQALREAPATPAGTVEAAVSGDWVAYRTDAGAVFTGTLTGSLSGGHTVQLNPDATGDAPQFSAQAIAVDDAGTVFAYAKDPGEVVRYSIPHDRVTGRDRIADTPAGAELALTAAGGTWFLVDRGDGRLWRRGGEAPRTLELSGDIAVGQARAAGDAAWIADDGGLLRLPADGSGPERVVGGPDRQLGAPARPIEDDGVVTAAWLGPDAGTLWRSDTGESALGYGEKALTGERRPVFTGSASSLILNDTRSGWVWNARTGALLPSSQDWTLDEKATAQTSDTEEQAQVVIDPKPPVAEPDAFGVRAGALAVLPVLLNDHDPNEDVLSVDAASITGLPDDFGTVSVTDNGQRLAVHIAAGARGSATLSYRVTDGTSADGLYSEPATVTLTVAGAGANQAPQWCGTDGCLAAWPSPEVAPGGTVTVPVMNGWVDPDGDPLMLLSVTDATGTGSVAATAAGDVVYQHADPSLAEPQTAQLSVTVGDTQGAATTRPLTVRITPKPALQAASFTVVDTVGASLTVDVAPHTSGTAGRVSLKSVRVLDEAPAQAVASAGGTAFDLDAAEPGVYRIAYTVTDGQSDASATARVTLLPADAPAQLATAPVVAYVRPQQDVTLDVFAAVSNPTRRVLLLSGVEPVAAEGATLSVDAVGQNYLRISGSTADGAPGRLGTVRYTVSDGTSDDGARVQGEASVYLLPPATELAPIAVDDGIVVRAGAQVDIPVLDNDVAASGGTVALDPAAVRSSTPSALAFASGRVLRYLAPRTPGDYRIEYSVYTSGSPALADTAVVRVSVISDEANRAPRPKLLTGRVLTGQSVTIPFRSFGADPDGDDVTLERIVAQPASGSATIAADGASIVYTSVAGFHGQVSFTYRATDALGQSGTGTARVGVLDAQANPSPVTFTDYVQVQAGADGGVRVSPVANDIDPTGGTLKVTAVRPDVPEKLTDGSANPEYDRLKALIADVSADEITIAASDAIGTSSYLYDVASSAGNTARGLIVVKTVREAVPDYPVIADTVLTAQTREQFPRGVDVVDGKVAWAGGDPGDLALSLWGEPAGVDARGGTLRGALTEHSRIIPFSLSGTTAAGEKVVSYAFLRIPAEDEAPLALKTDLRPQQVTERDSVTWDMASLVAVPADTKLEVGEKVAASGARAGAQCARVSGTQVRYTAGEGAPWTDSCTVPVRLAGQKDWTELSVPIAVEALAPVPVLAAASLTVSPGADATYDLKKLTTWQGREDWENLRYATSYSGGRFTVAQDGSTLTVHAADAAPPGSEEVAVVTVTSHPGVAPARVILRVGAVPSTLPRAGTVTQRCSQADGSACTVDVVGAPGEVNPLPNTPLQLVAATAAGTCTGVTFSVADASRVRASWSSDAPGQTCTAVFSVRDAQGRVTAGERDGRVLLDLQGYPKAPAAIVQSGYTADSVTLRVDPGQARAAYPSLSGFVIRTGGQIVARCDASGACPAIGAPRGEKREYTATSLNAVGESGGSVATVAWAYDAPPMPGEVTATPIPSANGEGGLVSIAVAGIDPSSTEGVRITSEVGESMDVPVRFGQSELTVRSYRIGTNEPSRLTVTPYSRFALPPGFGGETTGQSRTILAHGVGAPRNPELTLSAPAGDDSGMVTITATARAQRNGTGSLLRFGIVRTDRGSSRCDPVAPADPDATAYSATFSVQAGREYAFRMCAQSVVDGEDFGSVQAEASATAMPSGNGPKGYTFVVGPRAHVDGQRAQWRIEDAPTSATEQPPSWAELKFTGYPTDVFDRDPGIQVYYDWGLVDGAASAVRPRAGSAPYQVWAQWSVGVCNGGQKLQLTGTSSDGDAKFTFDTSKVRYVDRTGTQLTIPEDGTVPIGAVSVSRIGVSADWAKWGLDAATAAFSGTCTPNNPAPPAPTPTPAPTQPGS